MNAIYRNRLFNVVEASVDLTLETASGEQFDVEFGDDQLIVQPTDSEVADADNLAEHYGIDDGAVTLLRHMLRGKISAGQWWDWKAQRKRFGDATKLRLD